METKKETKRKHHRSPGYPIISLEDAIQRAKILWEKDKKNPIPNEVIYKHLGYKTQGGYGARVIAALKKYNLISEEGGYTILTPKAINIMVFKPHEKDYIDTIKEIALKPDIYKELWNKYNGSLPSDETIKSKLINEFNFNPLKIENFISNLRRTIGFAGLKREIVEEEINGERDDMSKEVIISSETEGHKIGGNVQSFYIPLFGNKKAKLIIEGTPIEQEDIDFLKQFIDLMAKPLTQKK